jgi:flagellar basal-body rod protein FlgB
LRYCLGHRKELPLNIFSAVSRHVDWLGQRLSVAAKNVANSDTPGYQALEIGEFRQTFKSTANPVLSITNASHFQNTAQTISRYDISLQRNVDVSHSGNDVSIEKEMQSVGDTSRQMSFDVSLAKLFHRMYVSSLKG